MCPQIISPPAKEMISRLIRSFLFNPPQYNPKDLPPGGFLSIDGIPTRLIRGGGSEESVSRIIHVNILYCHGNQEDLVSAYKNVVKVVDQLPGLSDDGTTAFEFEATLWDYPGYTTAPYIGIPTEEDLTDRAVKVARRAFAEPKFPDDITCEVYNILWGYSLGAGVACSTAVRDDFKPVHLLLLQAPWRSVLSCSAGGLDWAKLLISESNDLFLNYKNITPAKAMRRVVQMAKDDLLIPFDENSEAFRGKVDEFQAVSGGHETFFTDWGVRSTQQIIRSEVEEFLHQIQLKECAEGEEIPGGRR